MNISKSVNDQINLMKPGKFFTYQDIVGFADHSYAVIKAISRHAEGLGLMKVKKGLYYKVVNGHFGPMAPKDSDVIHYFTTNNNKTVGYITGATLYHRWGLTTQLPAEIMIATSTKKREKAEFSGLRITTTPARDKVNKTTIPLLQFLDVLKNIDRIPDANIKEVMAKLVQRLNVYSLKQINAMEDIAIRAYTARTKALLGAVLERYLDRLCSKLHQTLNPTSTYKISLANHLPINLERWYIVSTPTS
ncbi:MAG: hypothetical protein ACI8WB_001071 [Phenylobacterium sp.]|jgi:hypothetical protein